MRLRLGRNGYEQLRYIGFRWRQLFSKTLYPLEVNDMQIAEDLQMVVGHSLMQNYLIVKAYGKVLVIGSNSFSGSNFVNFLLRRGYEVFGCSRSKEANCL